MRLPVFPASVRALHSPGDGHWAFVLCGGMPVCLCACVRAYGRACAFFASPARPRVRLLHRAMHVQRHMCRRETLLCRGLSCPSAIRRPASRAMPRFPVRHHHHRFGVLAIRRASRRLVMLPGSTGADRTPSMVVHLVTLGVLCTLVYSSFFVPLKPPALLWFR